ncbi:MAG TPA: hypothetical protein VK699_09855 [Terriglobales bacterium]|jgi:hypothetical protein|nr:hypothetical protein [Terriglobales bacterium]
MAFLSFSGRRTAKSIVCVVAITAVTLIFPAKSRSQSASDDDTSRIEANPGRPTVSTPATLTPPGYFQLETGVLGAQHSGEFSNRTGISAVGKLSINRRFELLVQTEPVAFSDLGTRTEAEPGEVFAGVQAMIHRGEGLHPTVSVSYFRRLYASPAPELDIGTNRQSALLLVSFDVHRFHVDTNGIVTEQISDQIGVHRAQFGQTLSISHPLIRHVAIAGEIWHFTQPLIKSNAVGFLLAPSYTVNRFLVLDGGFDRGLTSTSTRSEVFVGLTYLLPKRLW